MAKLKDGFYKLTASSIGSDLLVLLAGGGAKPISDFAEASALDNYLPLSGGILTSSGNPLTIKRTDNSGPGLVFYSKDTQLGSIGISTDYVPKFYNANVGILYTMWHNGNDGSGSGLDADLLDGRHANEFMSYIAAPTYVQANLINSELWSLAGGNGYIEYYDNGVWFNSRWGKVMAHYGFEGSLSGNASSATKLQTARTIWGLLFDGSSDVTGDLLLGAYRILGKDAVDIVNAGSNHLVLGYGSSAKGWPTYIDGDSIYLRYGTSHSEGIFVNSSGNVGIGTTAPIHKLQVAGAGVFNNTGSTTYASNGITIGAGDAASRYITCYGKTGSSYINVGYGPGTNNSGEFFFNYVSSGSTSNYSGVGIYGGANYMYLYPDYTTFRKPLVMPGELYHGNCAINMSNSDIININALYTADNAESGTEGLQFSRGNGYYDSIWASSGTLYFSPNGNLNRAGSYSTNYTVIHSGNIGSQSVNYATSAGNADTVDSCHKDDFLRRTATLGSINKFVLEDIPKGVTQVGSIGWTDYQNYPHAGGLWMTLRGTSSLRTALILFPSYSMSSPPILYSSIDGGAWQGGYQLAYTSQIPTTMAWGNITGKPSTFTPSSHTHDDRYYTESEADSRFINHSGDTMTGPLTFANGTWNVVGDDAAIGDYNAAGMLGLKSINNNIPGIGFHNSSNTLLGRLQANGSNLLWNDNKIWHAGNDGSGSGLDADTVDGVHASSLSQIKYIGNTPDFCYDVILLCKRDVAHSARLDGLLFTTGGGVCRYHCADAHFWHSCWSVGSYDTQKSISNKGYDGYGFEFCTCTYGGAVWYAIKLDRIQAVSYFFMGNWDNINWTLITYYHTSQGVKNSEIYNSISNLTSTPLRYSGSIYAHHFYESSDSLLKINIVDINSSDNIPQLKSFDWKSDGSHSYGLIALELEEMGYPELVSNNGSYKTVNYSAALSLIVGKLQVKIKELEKEIEILKNKN